MNTIKEQAAYCAASMGRIQDNAEIFAKHERREVHIGPGPGWLEHVHHNGAYKTQLLSDIVKLRRDLQDLADLIRAEEA